MRIIVRGVSQDIADAVRRTRRAPGYGHPAHAEVASGTGPCRCCLRTFVPGRDERLLFTFRPDGDPSSLMAPGPVFIHAEHCTAHSGEGFPESLRALPLALEARAKGSRVTDLSTSTPVSIEERIRAFFENEETAWLHVRHAEAGCFIARVDRA